MLIPGDVKNLTKEQREAVAKRLASAGLSSPKVQAATGVKWWTVLDRFPFAFRDRWFSTVMSERRERQRRKRAEVYIRRINQMIEEAQVW